MADQSKSTPCRKRTSALETPIMPKDSVVKANRSRLLLEQQQLDLCPLPSSCRKRTSALENPIMPKDSVVNKANRLLLEQQQLDLCPLPRSSRDCRQSPTDYEYDNEGRRRGVTAYENTYRMAPNPKETFRSHVARDLMHDLLRTHLAETSYDKSLSVILTKSLAETIKEKMKLQTFSKRYKYVCLVTIGERSANPKTDGIQLSSRCLWDTDTDNFATASYKSKNLFAVATLYALYYA